MHLEFHPEAGIPAMGHKSADRTVLCEYRPSLCSFYPFTDICRKQPYIVILFISSFFPQNKKGFHKPSFF
ncbi:hypothetical protein CHH92_23165 [Bacillus sonorensis]|uniref:Uncharacterized protein n=1 Tax=Bacillus sonorensis L12 TaxID=1274524 RepID=M5PAK2_9BACI|nr:hypothetical protein BSONL12_22399 [Bacillus sonorensis L12]PAD57826.1 hypothetical protein CHH92_23165 [Bacillus sonorensis]RHJ04370.1 hypothetical protein DW143_23655 [Bacillus sonorensis]TWK77151.1 hypothetical protein CHCC20335_2316 [Bacillus paralicheniformis]